MAKVAVETEGNITVVSIDRFDEARNAVDAETAVQLREAFLAFDKDETQSVAILTGRGGTFCAGYDLKSVAGRTGRPAFDANAPGPMGPTQSTRAPTDSAAVESTRVVEPAPEPEPKPYYDYNGVPALPNLVLLQRDAFKTKR